MTDRHETDERGHAADRWLDQHQRTLVNGFDTALDIEAGLREVLLQSRHDALVNGLDTALDIEAGLAAILPTAVLHTPDVKTKGEFASAERFLRSVSPQVRMTLRVHPDIAEARLLLDRASDLASELDRASDLASDLASALDRLHLRDFELIRDRDPGRDHALQLAIELFLDLDRVLDRTFAIILDLSLELSRDRDLVDALELVRHLTRDLVRSRVQSLVHSRVQSLDRLRSLDRARELTRDLVHVRIEAVKQAIGAVLGRELPVLDDDLMDAFFNDFTTSDLRTADLDGVDLDGVRWSGSRTRWPDWVDVEDLKTRSEETPAGSGIWVVQSGTATVRDFAELT